jgi:hypothetical protein
MYKYSLKTRIFADTLLTISITMSIEEAIMGGIVFKGKTDKTPQEAKVKTKAKKKSFVTGTHGSGSAKMKADIRKKRANRHK